MRRPGVRTIRRGCQAGYATIYSGVEDSVTEDQQESLQNLAAKRPSRIFVGSSINPEVLYRISPIGEKFAISPTSQVSQFQYFTFGAGIALPLCATEGLEMSAVIK